MGDSDIEYAIYHRLFTETAWCAKHGTHFFILFGSNIQGPCISLLVREELVVGDAVDGTGQSKGTSGAQVLHKS